MYSKYEHDQMNQELRELKKRKYQIHAQQKSAFKKLIDSGLQITNKDHKIRKMIQLGVPSVYRPLIWLKCMENVHGVTLKLYHILLNKALTYMGPPTHINQIPEKQHLIKQLNSIEHDIQRTFPELKIFKKQNQQGQSLFNILSAWTVFREQIGYIQGMSQICGLLLIQINELEAFPIFCSIMTTDTLYAYYSMDLEQMYKFQYAFEQRLKRGDDKIYRRLKQLEIEPRSYILSWIMTLFTRMFSVDQISNLWDMLLVHQIDQSILTEVCYQIIKHYGHVILDNHLQAEQIQQHLKSNKINELQSDKILSNIRKSRL